MIKSGRMQIYRPVVSSSSNLWWPHQWLKRVHLTTGLDQFCCVLSLLVSFICHGTNLCSGLKQFLINAILSRKGKTSILFLCVSFPFVILNNSLSSWIGRMEEADDWLSALSTFTVSFLPSWLQFFLSLLSVFTSFMIVFLWHVRAFLRN